MLTLSIHMQWLQQLLLGRLSKRKTHCPYLIAACLLPHCFILSSFCTMFSSACLSVCLSVAANWTFYVAAWKKKGGTTTNRINSRTPVRNKRRHRCTYSPPARTYAPPAFPNCFLAVQRLQLHLRGITTLVPWEINRDPRSWGLSKIYTRVQIWQKRGLIWRKGLTKSDKFGSKTGLKFANLKLKANK